MGRAHAHESCGELIEIGLADGDRAGLDQPANDAGRALRREREVRAAGSGRNAFEIDVVLDREGKPPERLFVRIERPKGGHCRNRRGFRKRNENARITECLQACEGLHNDPLRIEAVPVGGVKRDAIERQ